ncbi:MAG: MGH1-like glycoside hydrolase domain-containing protein [Candidatus Promineifilaceae bacterium]
MAHKQSETAEGQRLAETQAGWSGWRYWGPYVAERAWGTAREDYSPNGSAWDYFPHDQARSRAYRWNEDGLAGFCNRYQNICLAVGLWNERDPILKERFFGLTGPQGNHGEDVKEYYFYLDSTPTHSYCKLLYKYPQVAYPYGELVAENGRRDRAADEFELIHALGRAWAENRYFDVFIEYAKAADEDILCRITAVNRGPEAAPLHILPHLWYRNNWSWGWPYPRPVIATQPAAPGWGQGVAAAFTEGRHVGPRWWLTSDDSGQAPPLLFTENETNNERLWGAPNASPHVKDAIGRAVVNGETTAVNPAGQGSKVAAHYRAEVAPGESYTVRLRFSNLEPEAPFADFEAIFAQRLAEADEFYAAVQRPDLSPDERAVQRQAFASLLWSKQFYHYTVELWLEGDPAGPRPPASRLAGRNHDWQHLDSLDVLSMPDKWEYPWFAAWDLAFHTLPIAMIDPEFAKAQLILLLREWYMHPNGQLPAYEWAFSDVNPPVHAWAAWRVYKIDRGLTGRADVAFLERVFHKLLLNFTWWVNRKDRDGRNIFQGGFLGLDNIGVFDRSAPLPTGGYLEQADGTAWMGMYCLNLLAIALELASHRPAYEDVATKFFEHFIYIANALNRPTGRLGLWDEGDGFYYDAIRLPDGRRFPLKIRSFVGLIPLFAVETLEPDLLEKLPGFKGRLEWFLKYRQGLVENIASLTTPGEGGRRLLSLMGAEQLGRVLSRVFDPAQFLSDYGLRSLSKEHEAEPYVLELDGQRRVVRYEPAESRSGLFGGNSNWRGPIWFPVNYLLIEALQKYHHYYGPELRLELPAGSGQTVSLWGAAADLSRRLIRIFSRDETGRRAFNGDLDYFQSDPHWRDHILFHEYFHGDSGAGVGASHQTGWTGLVAKLIQQSGGASLAPDGGPAPGGG